MENKGSIIHDLALSWCMGNFADVSDFRDSLNQHDISVEEFLSQCLKNKWFVKSMNSLNQQ